MADVGKFTNEDIAEVLRQIASYYAFARDKYRQSTYAKAAAGVASHYRQIKSGQQAKDEVSGVGPHVADDISDFLRTGKIARLEELQEKYGELPSKGKKKQSISVKEISTPIQKETEDYARVITLFKGIFGVGQVAADKFYKLGYRTLDQLDNYPGLTHAQKLGLRYYDDLQERINRSEMDEIIDEIGRLFEEDELLRDIQWEAVGSYRRGSPTSGDIDILISSDTIKLNTAVEALHSIIIGILAQGTDKFMGIIQLDSKKARRIDIRVFPEADYPYALLHSTGSDEYNRKMRIRANEIGLQLSEFSLHPLPAPGERRTRTVKSLPAKTEEDIFKLLGLKYVPPEKRSNTASLELL